MHDYYMTLIQEFKEKQAYLHQELQEVTPFEFYSSIFPVGMMERSGSSEDRQPNPIFAYTISGVNADGKPYHALRNRIAFADTLEETVGLMQGNPFAVCSLCSYSGRNRTRKNAYRCHGFAIDLDDVGLYELKTYFLGVSLDKLPAPTYLVNSGRGLHLYFIFNNPVPLYPNVVDHLQRLKHGLTWWVWGPETSRIKSTPSEDRRQYQGIFQGYRCPGSLTKLGTGKGKSRYRVTAYKWGDTWSIADLNRWVLPEYKIPETPDYADWDYADTHTTLEEAREKWPEWYQKRIVEQKPAGRYVINRALYDWWLNILKSGKDIREGNRYYCLSVLFIMAIKCNVDREEVWQDALELLEWFDAFTLHEENHFTIEDIKAAAKYYKPAYARYSINAIEVKTGIKIPRRSKPKNNQDRHVKIMTAIRDMDYPDGAWRNKNGRPDKSEIVRQWRKDHPGGKKADCVRDTGLSKPTVLKWWSVIK